MSFTYDLTAPTDITRVRFRLLDTDSKNPRFQDEAIQFALSEGGTVAQAVRILLAAEQIQAAIDPKKRPVVQNVSDVLGRSSDTDSGSQVVLLERAR